MSNTATAQGRLARLLTLVPYLLHRPGVEVSEAARTFGVTERQLIEDLQLIWMCGLPGHTPADLIDVSWDGGEIEVGNAETIDRPLRLTADEAGALLVALRMLAELPGLRDRDALDRTMAKLESAAGAGAAGLAGAVAVRVEADPEALGTVETALAERRRLRMRYYVPARDEATERDVDPMRLLVVEGRTYLEAWCRRAEAVRLFRLDRVMELTVLGVPLEVPPEAEPIPVERGLFRPSADDQVVTLELTEAGRWVADHYPCESERELPGGGLLVTLRTPDTRWVRRLALQLGSRGRVVAPSQLVKELRADAERALALYGEA